jgi:hypothetical protein
MTFEAVEALRDELSTFSAQPVAQRHSADFEFGFGTVIGKMITGNLKA